MILRPATDADIEWLVELRAVVMRRDLERVGVYDPVRVRRRFRDGYVPGNTRIVIADDNPVNTLIAQRALESAGFRTSIASTGRDALDIVEKVKPGLVLMDLRMPIMDGFEAIRQLRIAGNTVPVIAISAEINPEIERRARSAGADGVAAKPLDADALRRLANQWLGDGDQADVA